MAGCGEISGVMESPVSTWFVSHFVSHLGRFAGISIFFVHLAEHLQKAQVVFVFL
jgi:hypothetical protein